MKMPAFQFYPADWRKDPGIQALDRHDRSVWFDMLCIMHESDERGVLLLAGRPIPNDALARMLNLDNQNFNQTLSNLLTYGVASKRDEDGALYSRRMVRDEKICQIRREVGKKGGNPSLVNQNYKQNPTTGVKQNPTPSTSTSTSSSSSSKKEKPITSLRSVNVRKEPELFTSFWQTYPRKESRMDALRAFNKLNADEQATATQSVVEWFARKTDWIRPDGSDYRPYASSWINQKRWQDLTEITITQPPTPHGQPSATSNHFAGYQRSGTASSQYAFTDSAAFDAALQVIKELG